MTQWIADHAQQYNIKMVLGEGDINSGISHNPLESSTNDDMQLSVDAFSHLLNQIATETP